MPVKLLATNPFAEPARLEYELSPSPATRTYRWKRPLGAVPRYPRPTVNTQRGPVFVGRTNNLAQTFDTRQLFSMTQAASEHFKAASRQGFREESRSCDLDAYRLGTPSCGVNNNSNTNNSSQKSNSKSHLPTIKSDDGSRHGFEYRVGKQTYSRAHMLLQLQRRKKQVGKQVVTETTGDGDGRLRKDLPGIIMRESTPNSCDANCTTRVAVKPSDSGCYSKDSTGVKSRSPPSKGRKVDPSPSAKAAQNSDSGCSIVSIYSSTDSKGETILTRPSELREESDRIRGRLGFVEVATSLQRDRDSNTVNEDRSASPLSPVVSNDADCVCEELRKIVFRQSPPDLTCDTPNCRDDNDASQASNMSDKDRLVRALHSLQPPVPHVVWPENKYYTPHTVFVYGSPSRLAPVVVPSHSVDCPQCKIYQASSYGDICPPNSPTSWMRKDYGFYPVERHFGSK